MTTKTNLLSDVVVIRNILIVLLVFYHAFAIYSGAWAPLEGFPEIKAYWWLDKLSYAFMLELFVLISGYVFGYQVRIKGEKKLQAKDLFWGKFKRLMIPCMVFSLIYILLFGNIKQPIQVTLYGLLNGVGHMWFLPMLFWCFVGVWIIEKTHLKVKWALLLCVIASMCSFLHLPLRMESAMYYMLFFYVGYLIQRNNYSVVLLATKRYALITTISFVILFPLLTLLKERIGDLVMGGNQLVILGSKFLAIRASQIIYAMAGVAMAFSLVGCYLLRHSLKGWMEHVGTLSFGVYLFQQFILKGLYDHTILPAIFGCYLLPWLGFVVTLICSLFLSWLLRKTKIGKFLIG